MTRARSMPSTRGAAHIIALGLSSALALGTDVIAQCEFGEFLSPAGPSDYYAISVAISGDTAIVGAYADDERGEFAGAAYVLRLSGPAWAHEMKLLASDGAAGDGFGSSVTIDGGLAVIGARGDDDLGDFAGSAYVFRHDGLKWAEEAKLLASDGAALDDFGRAVAVDGDVILIGAPGDDDLGAGSGSVYVYRFEPDQRRWVEETKLHGSGGSADDAFGYAVALDGEVAVIGAPGGDVAHFFRFDPDQRAWIEESRQAGEPDSSFGRSVDINGDAAIIGAPEEGQWGRWGAGYVFLYESLGWMLEQRLPAFRGNQRGSSDRR